MGDRVLLVGLDAACLEQLDPFLGTGDVPTLTRLVEDGVAADMPTTTPPWTPSAWPSITTGTTPWTHGIYDFHHYEADGEARYVSAREVCVPFLWEVLSAAGHSSVVVNVPVTHPAHRFDGSLVPGYIAPEDATCLVDGGAADVASIDPDYRIYTESADDREARLADYEELIASRADLALELASRTDPSFAMVQFQSTDGVFHAYGDDREAARRVYAGVDDAIARLLAGYDPDWTIVASDHGIHQCERVFHCNTWLRDHGYVEMDREGERRTWNGRTVAERKDGNTSDDPSAMAVLLGAASRVGLTPRRVESGLSRVGLDEFVARLLPEDALLDVVDTAGHVDWIESAAFCRSSASLGIRCNVEGRDPGGVVPARDFADFRRTLVESLEALSAPDGREVFERVYDRHEVHGADVANEQSAPDVVFRPVDMVWQISDIVRERTFATTREYDHKYEGLFVAHGAEVGSHPDVSPTSPDVAPTVLSLLGVRPPEWMEGEPVAGVAGGVDSLEPAPPVPDRTYVDDARADEQVEDRLRELGYVE